MRSKITQFALAAVLAAGFAAPAFAQHTYWKLNSDHSTGRLSLASTADPNASFDVGIARVKGSVSLDASARANSSFDFIIYPADQDPASINQDGSLNAAEFSNVPRSTVINFRSREVKLTGDGDLAVTGDLTLTHLERPALITYSEAYDGPVYGEPEVRTATVDSESMPALVVSQAKQRTIFYDLTSAPPVLRMLDPASVKIAEGSGWQHASVLGSYNDAELGAILAFLRATR